MRAAGLVVKRMSDLALSAVGLLLLWPVLAVIALTIAVKLGRPVLFRQLRPGYRRRMFYMHKFRTMTDDRDVAGALLADQDRMTPLGEFLRRTSLDELPELVDVVKGDMSLVGPRPLLERYLPYYTEREAARFEVRPGMTGWAQVHGRNRVEWDERLELDAWYVEHWSIWLDARILVMTIGTVFRGQDVVSPSTKAWDLDVQRRQGSEDA